MITKSDIKIQYYSLESLCLRFNLARKVQVAKTTYQDFPGELDAEQYYIYKDPECFRTTTTVDSGVRLKTIIIADPTLSMLTPGNNLIYIKGFLNELFEKYHAQIFMWDGEHSRQIHNSDQFFQCYSDSRPLLKSELKQLKEKMNLNNDDVIILDHTSFQSLASYIYNASGHGTGNLKDSTEDIIRFPPLKLGPQLFTSDLFMSLDPETHEKIAAWHGENNYPLHVKLNGYAKNKLMDFIKQLRKYPQIILYFDNLFLSDLTTWLHYLKGLPVEQVVGLNRTCNPEYSEGQAPLLAEYINSLIHLRYLHVTLETSVSPLIFDLSHHLQLCYLTIHSRSKKNYTDHSAIPSMETADLFFLSKLPSNLRYLQLPAWNYSFNALDYLLNAKAPQLSELSVEPRYVYTNTNNYDCETVYLSRSACRANNIYFFPKTNCLHKPTIKVFSKELSPYVSGRISPKEEAFNPFRYTEIEDGNTVQAAHRIGASYLNDIYDSLVLYIKANQELSIEQLNEKIDELLQEEGMIEKFHWFFRVFTDLNVTLFSLLLSKIERINTLNVSVYRYKNKTDSTRFFTLPSQITGYEFSPPKIEYFKFYCEDNVDANDAQLFDRILSSIQITHHASLPGQFLYSKHVLERIQSLQVLEIDDASSKDLIQRIPEVIISSTMQHRTNRPKMASQAKVSTCAKPIDLNNDPDTLEHPEKTYSVLKIFNAKFGHEIPVNYYRMRISSGFRADEAWDNQAVQGVNISIGTDELAKHYYRYFAQEHGYYLGTYQFAMQDREWSVIPILGADDELFFLEANAPIELRYQWRQRAYEIRTLQAMKEPLSIRYIIKSSVLFRFGNALHFNAEHIILAKYDWLYQYEHYFNAFTFIEFTQDGIRGLEGFNSALPQTFNLQDKAKLICAYFASFGSGVLLRSGNLPYQIDQAIFRQKLGSCRHRAKLAHKLLNAMGIDNNLVGSNVHLFLDLVIDSTLVSVCLGGFRANTNILSQEDYLKTEKNRASEDDQAIFDETQLNEIAELQKSTMAAEQSMEKNPLLITYPVLDLPTLEAYQQWLDAELNKTAPRRQVLLLVDSLDELDSLEQQTRKYIHNLDRAFASIDNLQRVKFFELYINGSEQHQQDNELGALVKNGRHGDVLWVPIQSYRAATINPLFDHRRQLKNKKIPENVLLITLMERRRFDEMSDDFISRFPSIYSVQCLPYIKPITDKQPGYSSKEQDAMDVDTPPVPAEFIFGAPSLSFTDFAGGYELKGKALQWTEGWLKHQLRSQATQLSLVNAPFFLPEFARLMKSIKQGGFYSNGTLINLPAEMTFHFKEMDYAYPACFSNQPYSESTTIDFVLNKLSFINFFKGNYHVTDGQLDQSKLFDFADSKTLNVLVTDHFEKSEWYSLFTHAERMGLHLNLITVEGVLLPIVARDSEETGHYQPRKQLTSLVDWVECKKPHEMIATFARQEQVQIYLSSRTTVSDLLGAIVLNEGNSEEVIYKDTDFTRALKNGISIMLYGDPGEELRNSFESLLCTNPYLMINGKKESIKGSLRLCFAKNSKKSISAIEHEDDTVGNTENLVYRTQDASRDEDFSSSLLNTINEQRITLLTSLTASVKSFWVQLIKSRYQVHQLTQWLKEGGVLILDHYNNATLDECGLVEQLYHAKGSIYFQGTIYPISAQHKAVLLSSSKMKKNDPAVLFFNDQPVTALDYAPLSQNACIESVIWPAWLELCPDGGSPANRHHIVTMLEEYRSSRGASLESVAGSALTVLYFLWQSKKNIPLLQSADTALLCNLALQLLCPKRSLQNKQMRNRVQSLAMNLLENQLPATLIHGLTPMQSVMALNLLMQLRLLAEAKENRKLGRLMVKGILFEGAPGIGKTYLSLEILKSLGFREATLDDMETDTKKAYIQAPTDDLLRCKKIIKCAQERGYIVLLDELNTISLETTARNERSVIAQLTEAMEAGNEMNIDFFVIANQNTAASYSNRITLPPELLSLFMVIDPGHFRKRDYRFLAVIHKAEHPNECATLMKRAVNAYEKKPGAYRPPTIRTLLDYLMANNTHQQPEKRIWIADNDDEYSASKRRKIN